MEPTFYFALVDYEAKVLAHRTITSPDDRYISEKHLALHLHEALQEVPKCVSEAIREMGRPGVAPRALPGPSIAANHVFKDELKPIHADEEFWRR